MQDDYTVYILCRDRSAALAQAFLDRVAPFRISCHEEFEIPTQAAADENPRTPEQAINWLVEHPTTAYGLYWRRGDAGDPKTTMLFFTKDGHMIAGVDVDAGVDAAIALVSYAKTVNALWGYVTGEDPPPDSADEFNNRCESGDWSLINGTVRIRTDGSMTGDIHRT